MRGNGLYGECDLRRRSGFYLCDLLQFSLVQNLELSLKRRERISINGHGVGAGSILAGGKNVLILTWRYLLECRGPLKNDLLGWVALGVCNHNHRKARLGMGFWLSGGH